MLRPLNLVLLSMGRQGAFSLWSALNAHERLWLPDFATTDGLLLTGDEWGPSGPYAYQLHPPTAVPGMRLGCLVHGYGALDRMPGPVPARLAGALAPDAALTLVTRDPAANLRSMYATYLELFHGRRHFGLVPAGHRLYDREAPLGFARYVELAAYGVDYGRQLEDFGPVFERVRLFDFQDIFEPRLGATLAAIAALVGLEPEPRWGSAPPARNAGGHLIHQRLFGLRSKVEIDGFQFDLGFFGEGTDVAPRGSLEVPLDGRPLGGGTSGLRAFTSGQTWYRLPLAYRRFVLEGDGWELVEARFAEFRAYLAKVEAACAPLRVERFEGEALEVFERLVAPAARRFRDAHPEVARDWTRLDATSCQPNGREPNALDSASLDSTGLDSTRLDSTGLEEPRGDSSGRAAADSSNAADAAAHA